MSKIRVSPWILDDGTQDGWEVDFSVKYPDGRRPKRVRLQSPHKTKAKSEDWAERLKASLLAKPRPLTRSEKRLKRETTKKTQPTPTFGVFSQRYNAHLAGEPLSQSTRDMRSWQISRYLSPLFEHTPLDAIGVEAFSRLNASIAKKENGEDRSATNRNSINWLLYKMLETAKAFELLATLPPKPKRQKEPRREVDIYSAEEYSRLLEASKLIGWQAGLVVLLGGEAGLRSGEMMGLRWSDLDLVQARLTVRQQIVKGRVTAPKSKASRVIDLTPRLAAALKGAQHLMGELVLARPGDKKTKRHNLALWLSRSERKAKLSGDPKSLHKLRHTFASRCLAKGATLKEVQSLLGHSSLSTTLIYLHLLPSEGARAIKLLSGDSVESKG